MKIKKDNNKKTLLILENKIYQNLDYCLSLKPTTYKSIKEKIAYLNQGYQIWKMKIMMHRKLRIILTVSNA